MYYEDEIDLNKFMVSLKHYDLKVDRIFKDYPIKISIPGRLTIVAECMEWCNDNNIEYQLVNLGSNELFCFKDNKSAVFFKTYWGTITWDNL